MSGGEVTDPTKPTVGASASSPTPAENHYQRFVRAKKEWRRKNRGRWPKLGCPGCGYTFRGHACPRCGGE